MRTFNLSSGSVLLGFCLLALLLAGCRSQSSHSEGSAEPVDPSSMPMTTSPLTFAGRTFPADVQSMLLNHKEVVSLQGIEQFKALKELRLQHTDPHTSPMPLIMSLDPLAGLEHLEVLELPVTRIQDASPLGECKQLRYLDLQKTPISGIAFAVELEALTYLDLSQTKVADLSPLDRLPHLATLRLQNSRVAPDEVQRFQQVQPETEVIQ